MKTTMTVILPDGSETRHEIDIPDEPGYDILKKLVEPHLNGGDLEHVSVLWTVHTEPQRLDMFVDEDGRLKRLPRNEKATEIYRNNWLQQHKGADPESINFIVGPAVLFDRRVWF